MTTLVHDAPPVAAPRTRRRGPQLNARLAIGLALLAVVLLLAIVWPFISQYGTEEIISSDALGAPSATHVLGADNFGRDTLVRMAVGYRISLEVSVLAVLLGLVVGVPIGLIAGYSRNVVDNLLMRPLDVLMAFPPILLAITVMAVFGTGLAVLILAIGIVYVPVIARVTRASTMEVSAELFVEAARARGASNRRILLRHVLPNSIGPVIVQASILLGIGVLLEAALSFIGIGVKPPTPSLGLMLAEGREFMSATAWIVAVPGLAIMVLVLTFNLIGDGLHSWLDPRGRARLR
jgi:ABC-type dipeptide/oligopeptide/nickel transport system permease subunit